MQTLQTPVSWPKNGAVLLIGTIQGSSARENSVGMDSERPNDALTLALTTARKLLCEHSSRSAPLFDTQAHPDFRLIKPETEENKTQPRIKIDQIRDLIHWAEGKPQIADKKIAVIAPAHLLNIQAANALLKTLEEASTDALFILVTPNPSFLPATIRSRCFFIRLKTPYKTAAPKELELVAALKKDLQALKTDKTDPVMVAEQWIKQDPKQVLDCLYIIFYNQYTDPVLMQNKQLLKDKQRWIFLDKIIQAKKSLEEPNVPNLQLLMESLLIQYIN